MASPDAFVSMLCGAMAPPPDVIWNVTLMLSIGVLLAPSTRITTLFSSAAPTFALWLLPCATTMSLGTMPVAVTRSGEAPTTVASSACPNSGPSVHFTRASPFAFVLMEAESTAPPPCTTTIVIAAPATPVPASLVALKTSGDRRVRLA